MSPEAQKYNQMYLDTMLNASSTKDKVLSKVRDLWWPNYIASYNVEGYHVVLKKLDAFMNASRSDLSLLAHDYALEKGEMINTLKYNKKVAGFLKSNTGKMFERFVGLSIAYALSLENSDYCIVPFTLKWIRKCHGLEKSDFEVEIEVNSSRLSTPIDADLIAFNPTNPNDQIYLISVKSTLKDRFHNVPFWNLRRRCAISPDFKDIGARNLAALGRVKYVAICSDLAEEQPDFRSIGGPRKLLQIDASLLDGAYISAEHAKGIPITGDHMGAGRSAAFHNLNRFVDLLCGKP